MRESDLFDQCCGALLPLMTEQHPFTAAQNVAVLNQLLTSADADNVATFSFYYENAAHADLPYNQTGHETGFLAQVRGSTVGSSTRYVAAYQAIRNGTEGETFVTYYSADGYEMEIYRMPPSHIFLESEDLFLSSRTEFLVWCSGSPHDFSEELDRSRNFLLEIRRRGLQASPEQYR